MEQGRSTVPAAASRIHDMTDQIVLITGIGCQQEGWGNGLAIAMLFARQGAKIFGCDLFISAAELSKTRILAEFPNADLQVMQADATSKVDMQAFIEACMHRHQRIDILINNVGLSEKGDAVSMTEETWTKQIEVNLKSIYLTTHFVLPIMEKQASGGSVVNISSVAGMRYIGKPQVAYAAAKAAIIQFTKVTAVMYAAKGIRLNTVVPGLIDTPLVKKLADKYAGGDYERFRETRARQVPAKRMGTAFEVAHCVLFLASKEASYVTGTEIVVDGAFTCSTGDV